MHGDHSNDEAMEQLSVEEIRQLEARARARFADPEYRRRLESTDRVLDLLQGEQRR